ncbi:MAG: hypothetical protein RM347_008190 [Nostoc sp. ChiQUE02]|uniref:hypothetical protein n=1 Tax=Nostoc sp. ChiQUE02 TaxID=3075377 RepID=UPI002AD4142A|nr:hypothetical protein [Nostoc sp. ChiQUE02]MDZ8233075.1 hypothetical protein [Nostoc sp. ChiQUE02]
MEERISSESFPNRLINCRKIALAIASHPYSLISRYSGSRLSELEEPHPQLQYAWVKAKKLNYVGWVEARNPTFSSFCWVSLRSTQPTIILNPSVLPPPPPQATLNYELRISNKAVLYL